jgi:hypothetical protein
MKDLAPSGRGTIPRSIQPDVRVKFEGSPRPLIGAARRNSRGFNPQWGRAHRTLRGSMALI